MLTGIVETRQGDVRKRAELDDDGALPVTRSRPTANRIRTESGVIIEIEDGPCR